MINISENKQIWVIIPASGIGSRMQASIPKQYLPFKNKTVIEFTLDRLLSFDAIVGAVVVLNENDQYWQGLNYQNDKPVLTTTGDKERSGSVLNGLAELTNYSKNSELWVMIHDAVRPCITHEDLKQLVDCSSVEKQGLFLAHPVTDTLKKADNELNCLETVDRNLLWRAFTPQMFPFSLIYEALLKVRKDNLNVTDDVSAVQALNLNPKIILGRSDNIKITYPQDILIAETILEHQSKPQLLI